MTKQMRGPSGEILEVADTFTPEQMKQLYDELAAEGKTGEKYGVDDNTPLWVTAGNAAGRGLSMLPGLIPEAANLLANTAQWAGGTPWKDTQKIEDTFLSDVSFKGLDKHLGPKGLGLFQHMDPKAGPLHRAADFAGELAAGSIFPGTATKQGMKSLLGAFAGGTVGGELVDPMLPDEYKGTGKMVGALGGGLYGAYRGIDVPDPKMSTTGELMDDVLKGTPLPKQAPVPTPEGQLELPLGGGRNPGQPKITPKQGELPLGPGGGMRTPPPAPEPMPTPPTPEQVQKGTIAQQKLDRLLALRGAAETGDVSPLLDLQPKAPGILGRVANKLGLNTAEKAGDIALHDSIKNLESLVVDARTPPSVIKETLGTVLDHIGFSQRIAPNTHLRLYSLFKALRRLGGPSVQTEIANELKRLNIIIRSGAPVPTRGEVVRGGVRGLMGAAGRTGAGILDSISVEKGPNDVILGSGPMLFKRPRAVLKDRAAQEALPDADKFVSGDTYYRKWAPPNLSPTGHPKDFSTQEFPDLDDAPPAKGILTYHGSPARYDKVRYDPSLENTGAGGASFGHGIYSAEEPKVVMGTDYASGAVDLDYKIKDIAKHGRMPEGVLDDYEMDYSFIDPTGQVHQMKDFGRVRFQGRSEKGFSFKAHDAIKTMEDAIEAGERNPEKLWQLAFDKLDNDLAKELRFLKPEYSWQPPHQWSGPSMSKYQRQLSAEYMQARKDLEFMYQKKLLPARYAAAFGDNIGEMWKNYSKNILDRWERGDRWAKTLYKFDIDAKPEDLIDFDKPLFQQPEKVRRGLLNTDTLKGERGILNVGGMANMRKRTEIGLLSESKGDVQKMLRDQLEGRPAEDPNFNLTGEDAYWTAREDLLARAKRANPEQIFLKEGILGNRYFDGLSRGAKDGTRNYVIWDPEKITILARSPLQKLMIPGAAGVFFIRESDVPPEYKEGIEG